MKAFLFIVISQLAKIEIKSPACRAGLCKVIFPESRLSQVAFAQFQPAYQKSCQPIP
jgi:hypothetical protein